MLIEIDPTRINVLKAILREHNLNVDVHLQTAEGSTVGTTGATFIGVQYQLDFRSLGDAEINNVIMALREAQVFTVTADPGGGDIPDVPEEIPLPPPRIDSLTPSSTRKNTATPLQLTGANFTVDSQINFNGVNKVTTYLSPAQLRCTVTSAETANRGSLPVYVSDVDGQTSNVAVFSVT
jgi:hypothetical protein